MHEPPVQSDRCAFSGNYRLESNPERHAKTPLAAAIGRQDVREMYREFLKWWPDCGYTERTVFGDMSRTRLLPRLENLPGLTNLRKNHLPGWFFRFQSRRLRVEKDDLKKILFFILKHLLIAFMPSHLPAEGKPFKPIFFVTSITKKTKTETQNLCISMN